MTNTLSQALIDRLIKQAKRVTWAESDDIDVYDFSGGNVDDAYDGGCEDGETNLAQEILTELGISWE